MEALSNFFEENSTISTKHGEQGIWIQNTVLRLDSKNNILHIPLKQEYISRLIIKGDSIEIKKETEEYLFVARGTIIDILIDDPQRIIILIDSTEEFINKRANVRYNCNLNCIIKGEEFDDIGFGIVQDISSSGIGIASRYAITTGSVVFIDIVFGDGNLLKLKGNIIRKSEKEYILEYGLQIAAIDDTNKILLFKLLRDFEEMEKDNKTSE